MGHSDLKRSKNVYFNIEFSREISNSPEKIFSLFRREILKRDSPFEFGKGDFKARMSFLPSIGRFRRENLPSMFSKGDFIKSILPGRKVGHLWSQRGQKGPPFRAGHRDIAWWAPSQVRRRQSSPRGRTVPPQSPNMLN